MLVIRVDQGLNVAYLDHLALILAILNQRSNLHGLGGVRCQQLLNFNVIQKLVLSDSKNFTCLFLRHETSSYAQALLSDLLSASVMILLGVGLVVLLTPVNANFLETLLFG